MNALSSNIARFILLTSFMCIMSDHMYASQSLKASDEKRCSATQQILPKIDWEQKDCKALLDILAYICQFPTVIGQEIVQYAYTEQHYEYNQMLTPERSDSEGYRHPYWITCFKLLSTQALAIGCNNGTIDIWDMSNRKFKSLIGSHTINALTELNNGMLASAAQELIYIWNTKTGTYMYDLIGHTGQINALVFLAQKNRLISAADDTTIRIWNPVTRTCEGVIVSNHGATTTKALALLPDGSLISINTHCIQTWDTNSLRSTQWLQTHHWGDYVDTLVLPGNILASSCSSKSSVQLWDMNTGLRTAKIPIKDPTKLAYLGNQHLLVGCKNGAIVIIDILTKKPIQKLAIPNGGRIKRAVPLAGGISGLEVLPDGRFIASLYDSTSVHIFRPTIEFTKPTPSRTTRFVNKILGK